MIIKCKTAVAVILLKKINKSYIVSFVLIALMVSLLWLSCTNVVWAADTAFLKSAKPLTGSQQTKYLSSRGMFTDWTAAEIVTTPYMGSKLFSIPGTTPSEYASPRDANYGNVVVSKGNAIIRRGQVTIAPSSGAFNGTIDADYNILLDLNGVSRNYPSVEYRNLLLYDPRDSYAIKKGRWKGYVKTELKLQVVSYTRKSYFGKSYCSYGDHPLLRISPKVKGHPALTLINMGQCRIKFTYYKVRPDGTDRTEYKVNANSTYGDIDACQALVIDNSGVKQLGTSSANSRAKTHLVAWNQKDNINLWTSDTGAGSENAPETAAGWAFSGVSSEKLTFVSNQKGNDGAYSPGEPNGNLSFFSTSIYSVFSFKPMRPVKYISTADAKTSSTGTRADTSVTGSKADSTQNFASVTKNGVTTQGTSKVMYWQVEQAIPAGISTDGNQVYTKFEVTDNVDSCLKILDNSTHKPRVYNQYTGKYVNYFSYTINKTTNTITFTAKAKYLSGKSGDFYCASTGTAYIFEIPTKIRDVGTAMEAHDGSHIISEPDAATTVLEFSNSATTDISSKSFSRSGRTAATVSQKTGKVYSTVSVKPATITLHKEVTKNGAADSSLSKSGYTLKLYDRNADIPVIDECDGEDDGDIVDDGENEPEDEENLVEIGVDEDDRSIAASNGATATNRSGNITFKVAPGTYSATEVLSSLQKAQGYNLTSITATVRHLGTSVDANLPLASVNQMTKSFTAEEGDRITVTFTNNLYEEEGTVDTPDIPPGEDQPAAPPEEVPAGTLIITKTLASLYNVSDTADGLRFLIEDSNGKPVTEDAEGETIGSRGYFEMNTDGFIKLDNLTPGTYTVTEVMDENGLCDIKPSRYTLTGVEALPSGIADLSDSSVTLAVTDGETSIASFTNSVTRATLSIKKETYMVDPEDPSEEILDEDSLSGIRFTVRDHQISGPDGQNYLKNVFTEKIEDGDGAYGLVQLSLKPGTYSVEETSAHAKYYRHDEKKYIYVASDGRIYEGTSSSGTLLADGSLTFENHEYTAVVTKYARDTSGDIISPAVSVQGATYLLYRIVSVNNVSTEVPYGSQISEDGDGGYVTDEKGRIIITGLEEGSYILRETSAPSGFLLSDIGIPFTVSGDSQSGYGHVAQVTAYNTQTPARIEIAKRTESGSPLAGATFALYDNGECMGTPVSKQTTGADGIIVFDNLEWNLQGIQNWDENEDDADTEPTVYYLKEIKAPTGYLLDPEIHEYMITTRSGLYIEEVLTNQKAKGEVQLTKLDGDTPVPGATYNLCKSDGTVVRSDLVTDSSGKATADNLEWGSYYFVETAAPSGYGLSFEHIIFTVNKNTAGKVQRVTAEEPAGSASINVTKRILKDDFLSAHGDACFTFRLTGGGKEYYRTVVLNDYAETVTVGNVEYYQAICSFSNLETDVDYLLTECDTARYVPSSVAATATEGSSALSDGVAMTATFNLQANATGEALYYNDKIDWTGYSDATEVVNSYRTSAKITGISAVYEDDEMDSGESFDREKDLKVYVIYDSGEEALLDSSAYSLAVDLSGGVAGPWTSFTAAPDISESSEDSETYTVRVTHETGGTTYTDYFSITVAKLPNLVIRFRPNGGTMPADFPGTVSGNQISYTVRKNTTLAFVNAERCTDCFTPSKGDLYFDGWYTSADFMAGRVWASSEPVTENLTLYAKWVETPVIIDLIVTLQKAR